MIDEYQLIEFSDKFRDIRQLEKDYILQLLLYEISNEFSNDLIFKGGTALKYFYNLNRFSEDLDFSFVQNINNKNINEEINKVFKNFNQQYQILEKESRANKQGNKIIGLNYEMRIKGPLNRRLNHLENVKIDISFRNDILHKSELKYFSPLYPDIPAFSLQVMDIKEILAEKVAAVIERTKMRDIYDIYYLLIIKKVEYNEKLIKEKMQKRNEIFKKQEFIDKIDAAKNKMKWKSELSYLINPLPDNSQVVSELKKTII